MASRVSAKVKREEAAAACKLGTFHWETLWIPVTEVAIPTTPARREKMTKKPVARFPTGKNIGNMRAGGVKTEAAIDICYRKF